MVTPPQEYPQPPSSITTTRRLPPPCWSHDETVALIDGYREKWYSLRRGNLRAPHWQEVADAVAATCPIDTPKTSVQCRHKMEKLRKRYRAEIQRAFTTPSGRYCSSWVHFNRMDSMEKGTPFPVGMQNEEPYALGTSFLTASSVVPVNTNPDYHDDQDEDFGDNQVDPDQDLYPKSVKHGDGGRGVSHNNSNNRGFYGSMSNGIGNGDGFRIRIPKRPRMGPRPEARKFDESHSYIPNPYSDFGSSKVLRDGYMGKGGGEGVGKSKGQNPVGEMVSAIKALGDGFVRMERMKMEMAREVEAMRMEMEMKRTEMILESQQMIVETLANGFSERKNKKAKRMPMPET